MTLAETVTASLVLMIGSSAAAQVWSQTLRASSELARQEAQLQALDALLLASEGQARALAKSQGPATDCPAAIGQLVPLLRALPSVLAQSKGPGQGATLTLPPSAPGMLHVRWESAGVKRERMLSASVLGLCREAAHGP
ncbi:MAG: hypothetical protein VKM17_02205 [Cyanobacteriota bacterium]|jgi:hypothetical protein|nr:hypothetical protein [Cyanobacteriota bacterium]